MGSAIGTWESSGLSGSRVWINANLSFFFLLSLLSCRVVFCRVVSCRLVMCPVVSCRVVSCRFVSCGPVSCGVVSCRFGFYCVLFFAFLFCLNDFHCFLISLVSLLFVVICLF